ncbi:Beta-lactamase-like domain protein, partial [mine drainage metagenome]
MPGRTELWLETFRHPELGNASYLVGSGREAGVIDPVRDVGRYLISARERGAQIRWVLETHLHNDFLSGGRELARRAGAVLGGAPGAPGSPFPTAPYRRANGSIWTGDSFSAARAPDTRPSTPAISWSMNTAA